MDYIIEAKFKIPADTIKELIGFNPPALLAQISLKRLYKKFESELKEEIPGAKLLKLKVKKVKENKIKIKK